MNPRMIDIALEIASFLLLAISLVLFGMQYSSLPETIPIHFNLMGEADGYGSKESTHGLVAVFIGMYLLFTVLMWFPRLVNLPVKITDANREHIYARVPRILRVYKLLIVGMFCYPLLTITGSVEKIHPAFLCADLGIMLLYTLYIWYRLRQVSREWS